MGMKQLEHAPPSRLGEIQARADAATAGPWVSTQSADEESTTWIESPWGDVLNHDERGSGHLHVNFSWMKRLDADFIAHARVDVPELVEALRAVETVHTQELGGTPSGEFADICGGCPNYWPCPTITAIRGVLP